MEQYKELAQQYRDFLCTMGETIRQNDQIQQESFQKYNVKRGLRNADGTGVLVGLTHVGDVRGYIMEENEKIAVPGKLIYRGVNVNDLVAGSQKDGRFGFEEVAYLLLTGRLPNKEELKTFFTYLDDHRRLPGNFTEDMIMKAPSPDIMNKLARSTLALYSYDEQAEDKTFENVLRQCMNLIAQFPIMAAYAYQAKAHYYDGKSLFLHNPEKGMSTSETFLHLIRPDGRYTKLEAEILDLCLTLHAEHGGGNNSSFAIRVISSSGTDTYAAVSAAIGSLKGPKHGGANLKVIGMMEDIKAHVPNWTDRDAVFDYLETILRKEAYDHSGLIYGMGHAVYTVSDPRAELLKAKAEELAAVTGHEKEFELYKLVEELAPAAFAKVRHLDKDICANVDLYSGFVYSMLDIPKELYTPIFAISRVAGWTAHRLEELVAGSRIMRPAYKNIGKKMPYVPLEDR